jgi:hypothetical protein
MGVSFVSCMSRSITFRVRSSEYLEPSSVPLFPPVLPLLSGSNSERRTQNFFTHPARPAFRAFPARRARYNSELRTQNFFARPARLAFPAFPAGLACLARPSY